MATTTRKSRSSSLLGKRKVPATAMKKAVREVVLSHYGSVTSTVNNVTEQTSKEAKTPKPMVKSLAKSRGSKLATGNKAFVGKQ